jgi:hypothetical protein
MYKKIHLFLIGVALPAISIAQTTISAAQFNPQAGDAFISRNCVTTGVYQGNSGGNVTWDFTGLITSTTDTSSTINCSQTPNCAMFPGSIVAVLNSNAGQKYDYLSYDNNKLSQNGYFQSVDTNAVYTDPMDQLHYPLAYQDIFSDTYAGIVTYGLVQATESGIVYDTCDGWGTLKLPTATYNNTLRVHSFQQFTDSANLFGNPVIETFNFSTYTWYTPDFHTALLTILYANQIGGSNNFKTVTYAAKNITGVPVVTNEATGFEVFPNPANGAVNVKLTTAANEKVQVSLNDITGRQIGILADENVQGTKTYKYNTSNLAKGLYFIHLQAGNYSETRKLEVE